MTIPRELRIVKVDSDMIIASTLVKEIASIRSKRIVRKNVVLSKAFDVAKKRNAKFPCLLNLSLDSIKDFSIAVSNDDAEELVIGYDKISNQYYIDRTRSGKTNFQEGFAAKHVAPRFTDNSKMNVSLLIDVSSIELFADDGLTVMTEIFFPNKPYNKIQIESTDGAVIKKLEYLKLKSIWK